MSKADIPIIFWDGTGLVEFRGFILWAYSGLLGLLSLLIRHVPTSSVFEFFGARTLLHYGIGKTMLIAFGMN